MNMVLEDAEEKEVTNPDVKMWIDDLKDVAYTAEDILDEIATEALRRQLLVEFKRVAESNTFGTGEDKKKVVDLLLSSDAGGNEMCVIAIVGMGGIGKTTLAQLVYNESRVKQHFDLKIWFCVSEEFVMPNVEKSIIEAATSLPCPKFENPEQLQVTLKKNLSGKKFLLVLDDVWSEKPIHQEFLSQLLHHGSRGSKILVTTRNESVALAMKAIATHHLKLLSKDDCWSLFEKHAFRDGSSNADPEIKEIGTKIVKNCKGLPLAIKAIGDLLWSESSVERWTNILKSNLWDLSMEGTNILPALRSSEDAFDASLKDKAYLENLVLEWCPPEEVLGITESQRGVLENLQPHRNLKSLTINYYGARERLNLSNCKYWCALPPVGQLSSLNELVIDGLDGVVTVGPEFYGNNSSTMKPFGMLKSLRLKNMRNWKKWFPFGDENEGGSFPRLEKLYIVTCPKLRGRLPVHLHSLAKLEISGCQRLEGSLLIDSFSVLTHIKILGCGKLESLTLAEQYEHDGITNFNISCLRELIISGCSSLMSIPMVVLISTLKTLEIDNCKKLELPMH
ncbi:putative disease resistance RPP13-like protein 1 [Juglans microcarpa x Juglans regia]|uniref:putative disease resistance RPP13-like protein 1 n=1 Tax=Juglans microcarpa x Juglans regia TaxID=2249226 RepID=UPI001B7E1C27|nr:putative disease resistance RPP13-like protein 1 [Juglans microcarpa x Juglans regia]